MTTKQDQTASWLWLWAGLIGVAFTLVIVLGTPLIYWILGNDDKSLSQVVLDDQYGIANALISGLAFAGLLATILQQREDLRLQARELDESQDLIQQQILENTLFQMMTLREKIVSEIVPHTNHQTHHLSPLTGRNAISEYVKELIAKLEGPKDLPKTNDISKMALRHDKIAVAYEVRYSEIGSPMLSHYFRLTYNIVKYIDENANKDQCNKYMRVFRSQLSDDELLLLFYNCVSSFGFEKFMPLADKHNLFNNLPTYRLSMIHDREFSRSSFSDDYKDPHSLMYDPECVEYYYRNELEIEGSYKKLCKKYNISDEVDLLSLRPR